MIKGTSVNKSQVMVMVLAYLHDPLQQTQTVNGKILHTKLAMQIGVDLREREID